ncbi:hypothetical protein XA68_17704 [Ophiocordyceps unilateralis]|uniref:Endo-chitosanase n=1 Tax=Ophiocordyceps unilateralis TaxID=268505 RepID=A0A2A9P3H7_OPHUN|nr:hypothetical protein XA68_17704 [Ophiocordyceps unilateralis]
MDIDCDGDQKPTTANDNRCEASTDTQARTRFREKVRRYGIPDLNPHVHTYVVFGNEGSKPRWPVFDPQQQGIKPLSVMAVVCNNKLIYGVWGDTNGDDGSQAMVGEASISLATACFGDSMTGGNGHNGNDILYLAFPGRDAVPGAHGADWNASTFQQFERSLAPVGDRLLRRIAIPKKSLAMPTHTIRPALTLLVALVAFASLGA